MEQQKANFWYIKAEGSSLIKEDILCRVTKKDDKTPKLSWVLETIKVSKDLTLSYSNVSLT